MKPFKRISALIVAALAGVGILLATATPALADTPPSSCTASSVCGYVNVQYRTDQGYELNPQDAPGTCVVVFYRNAWSGVFNNTNRTIRLFKNTGCTGTDYKQFAPFTGKYQFSVQLGITWDNSVDAYKVI